jgi:hypothetical protein
MLERTLRVERPGYLSNDAHNLPSTAAQKFTYLTFGYRTEK